MSNAETVEQSEHVFFFVFDEQKKKYGLHNVIDSMSSLPIYSTCIIQLTMYR